LNRTVFRTCLLLSLLAMPLAAAAIGLGELRGQPALGERLRLEIDILGVDQRPIDASCFRLIRPTGAGDLPWLQQASFSVRSGRLAVLEIRSATALRDPILQIGVQLGCGYEISRQYMLLATPASEVVLSPAMSDAPGDSVTPQAEFPARRVLRQRAARADEAVAPPRIAPRRAEPRARAPVDRLMLSGGGEAGEQVLQLATELSSLRGGLSVSEAQREILRLEFRMLMVLNEQAMTQMATAEKLRNMEATLGELQVRAGEFAGRVEQVVPLTASPASGEPPTPAAAPPAIATLGNGDEARATISAWSLYGALIGILVGLAGWLGWRHYSQRRQMRVEEDFPLLSAEVDPEFDLAPRSALAANASVDIRVEPVSNQATRVDFELDAGDQAPAAQVAIPRPAARDSAMSIAGTTVGEHFEANPVMELADIMLSFGRVKGAAQALREYIDSNPQEALQPWIRLMDVYRMAGMRDEFEEVGRNLNQHFNIEVQHWEKLAPSDVPAAGSIEEMPRIMSMISELWWTGDVVGYLYQLLRDNRGGKRAGFALPLVEEILFLIELKETSNRIEKKEDKS